MMFGKFLLCIYLCSVNVCKTTKNVTHINRLEHCRRIYNGEIGERGRNIKEFPTGLGVGWDNLQNLPRSQIFNATYDECRLTPDLEYFIADGVDAILVKTTRLDRFANSYESYQSYADSTSNSINVAASGGIKYFQVSGSFSARMQEAKRYSVGEQASIFRTTLEHHAYTALVEPSTNLNKNFKRRLLEIGNALLKNHTKLASYLSQLVIRDYGTHVVTNVDVGVLMLQEDFVDKKFMQQSKTDSSDIRAAAAASFLTVAGVSVSAGRQVNTTTSTQYQSMLKHSRYISHGGPDLNDLLASTVSKSETTPAIKDLVVLDRSGEPLFMLVNEDLLPELPMPTVASVQACLKNATDEYYARNTIFGCQQPDAENFKYNANVNDSSCKAPYNNYTFGGLFQTCMPANGNTPQHRCNGFVLKNGITNDFGCNPPEHAIYEPKMLFDTIHSLPPRKETHCQRSCYHCGFLWLSWCCDQICHDTVHVDEIRLQAFWCSAVDSTPLPQDSGYMFGGLFTAKTPNPFNSDQSSGCPGNFVANKIGSDLHVCMSRDYQLDGPRSVKFSGFFSCHDAVQRCNDGYTQHLAEIVDGCETYYCVRPDAFSYSSQTKVVLPPFMNYPYEQEAFTVMQSFKDGRLWHRPSVTNGSWEMVRVLQEDGTMPDHQKMLDAWNRRNIESQTSNVGLIVGVTVGCVVLLIICISITVYFVKRNTHLRHSNYEPIEST